MITRIGVTRMSTIGQKLYDWRQAARMTQTEVARHTGIPQHTISRLETGEIDKPGFTDVVTLASYYGVSPNELAKAVGAWVPNTKYESEDYRLTFVLEWLYNAEVEDRDTLLTIMYDRAIFLTELRRIRESHQESA